MAETTNNSHPTFNGDFVVPKREVFAIFDMAKWYRSEAYENYINFIHRINDAVKGLQSTDNNIIVSERVKNVIAIFDELGKWVEEFPLEDMQEQRFGNKTYRKWYQRLQERADDIITKILPEDKKAAKVELLPYFLDSFGNSTRIDYGSGHEVAFLFFIYCLYSVGALNAPEDDKAVVLRLFARYLRFVRLLQNKYRMEPAGSRGVHAIDDFQFAPFIFGSSQLIGNKQRLTPDHYLNPTTVETYQRDNLFFEAIQYINETKYGPFYEHSNQLYNISAVPSWEKVNSGMFKMYEGECLKKFPVAQHFVFGSILNIQTRQCCLQRDEETRIALEKEKEPDQKKSEDSTKEKHLLDTVQPMDPIQEDPIEFVKPMDPIPETTASE
jgi:serine/threonine-protein phosphatase 2A activator|uniref:Serine/threonine-protein phosphatase 2A activator n=1 Tax=Panagrolaimus sp. PS1159 TaxID=55785 RepID=A0AC35FQQ2_9BILA